MAFQAISKDYLDNCSEITAFSRIPFAAFGAGWATVSLNNLALYLKDLKTSLFIKLKLKLIASSLE